MKRVGECLGCGSNCCSFAAIPVNLDREQHADYLLWLSYHDIEIKDIEGVGQLAILPIQCKQLQPDGKCALYGQPERPIMCERWPQQPWEIALMAEKGQRECGFSFVKEEVLSGSH